MLLETVSSLDSRMLLTQKEEALSFFLPTNRLYWEGDRLRLQTTYVRSPTLYRMKTRYHGNFQLPDRLWFQTSWQDRSAKIIICWGQSWVKLSSIGGGWGAVWSEIVLWETVLHILRGILEVMFTAEVVYQNEYDTNCNLAAKDWKF